MDVTFEDFKKAQLKIARIVDVEEIPGADRIWKLSLKVGEEKKQIVAGIKSSYSKEELVGKLIVIVSNLAPAVIRGVESQGMLLAAKDASGAFSLLTLERPVDDGSLVG